MNNIIQALHIYTINFFYYIKKKLFHDFNNSSGNFLLFTYRYNFDPIYNSNITSDVSWGCIIRVGQMLLAKTLLLCNEDKLNVVKLFTDNYDSPFSIQNIVYKAQILYDIKPGEWYKGTIISSVLSKILNDKNPNCKILNNFKILTYNEGSIIIDDLDNNDQENYLILISTVIGIDKIDSYYYPIIIELLSSSYCVGLIGGQNNKAYYVFSSIENNMLYLDPHLAQPYVNVADNNSISSYIPTHYFSMPIQNMQSSLTYGFYVKKNQSHKFLEYMNNMKKKYNDLFFISFVNNNLNNGCNSSTSNNGLKIASSNVHYFDNNENILLIDL